jgi:L-alanine-DL-glutamate epimerase-like enolase superfamily enzyme
MAVLRCADIFQPDPAFCGGITEAMRISALASGFNLRFAPHLWAGAPCFFAGLHLCAASPASFTIEYSCGANPMIHDLIEGRVTAHDGMVAIPDGPGLGFSVSDRVLKDHIKS